jgi:hypothetical protein
MNEVSSRSHAVCIIIVEKCTTNLNGNTDSAAAAAAAAMGVDNMGLLMASGGPSSRKAVAAAAALTQQLQHSIKVSCMDHCSPCVKKNGQQYMAAIVLL